MLWSGDTCASNSTPKTLTFWHLTSLKWYLLKSGRNEVFKTMLSGSPSYTLSLFFLSRPRLSCAHFFDCPHWLRAWNILQWHIPKHKVYFLEVWVEGFSKIGHGLKAMTTEWCTDSISLFHLNQEEVNLTWHGSKGQSSSSQTADTAAVYPSCHSIKHPGV